MAKRITDQQIALAKQYFRDGYSIPECCQMTSMSKASFNKYCGREVKSYIEEHTKAKELREQNKQVAEIMPTQEQTSITQLSLSQFSDYVEFEFSNAPDDISYLKDLFDELKTDSLTYDKVIKLRELYEQRLSRIGKTSSTTTTNKELIKQYKQKLGIHIPVARKANEWDELRLLEHICYWCKYSEVNSHKAAIEFVYDTCSTRSERLKYLQYKG